MYKKRTNFFRIPYISDGELLDGQQEELKMKLLDNLLYAGVCGVSTTLFEDGDYTVLNNQDGTYTVTVIPTLEYSVLGIVNFRLFYSRDIITFDNLLKGNNYYLYIGYNTSLDVDCKAFNRIVTTVAKPNYDNNTVLLAKVNLMGDVPVLMDNPDDKVYSKDILAHTTDQTNPHGRVLRQDKILVSDQIILKNNPVYETRYQNIITKGTNGVDVIVDDGSIVHINVMPLREGLGEYWFENIHGKFKMFNTGNNIECCLEIKIK